jgi:uncharacterized membrane protein YeaQ/YmgE (transglycosylase-associated protein family)
MDLGHILAWIIFGGLAGWIATLIVGADGRIGLLGNIVVGIIGAFIGGALLPNDGDQFDLGSFVAAVLGAILLLVVVNLFTRDRRI